MINKTKLALGIAAASLTMTGALISPQAMAHSKAERVAEAASNKANALEAQLQAMQAELASLRAQANRPVSSAEAAKVQELDQWMNSVKSAPKEKKTKDNMVYFRGGFAANDQHMPATTNTIMGSAGLISTGTFSDKDGWNFGAGFDFSLSDDMFGLVDKTELLAELDVDYVEFGKFTSSVLGPTGSGVSQATQSQLRLTAAPKVKLFKGSKLRPWVIPAGFTLNVMSPPSQANTITELMPAMHFGAGVDYNIWKNLYVGTDVRYNWAFNKLDGTNTNGYTAGGYLGIGF